MRKMIIMFIILLSLLFINGCDLFETGATAGTYVTCDYCTDYPCRLYTRVYGGVTTYCLEQSYELGSGCPTTGSNPWTQIDTCTAVQCTTYPDGSSLSPPANDGTLYCNPSDDKWYECSNGNWIYESTCDGECILGICEKEEPVEGDCVYSAISIPQGTSKCIGVDKITCLVGKELKIEEGACDECYHNGVSYSVGSKICFGQYPQSEYSWQCQSGGNWGKTLCPAGCLNGDCKSGECYEGNFQNEKCFDTTTVSGEECINGQWQSFTKECAENKKCEGGVCVSNIKKCYKCVNEQIDVKTVTKSENCPSGYQEKEIISCEGGTPIECIPDNEPFFTNGRLFTTKGALVLLSFQQSGGIQKEDLEDLNILVPSFSDRYKVEKNIACCSNKSKYKDATHVSGAENFIGLGLIWHDYTKISYEIYECLPEDTPTPIMTQCPNFVRNIGQSIGLDKLDCVGGWILTIIGGIILAFIAFKLLEIFT